MGVCNFCPNKSPDNESEYRTSSNIAFSKGKSVKEIHYIQDKDQQRNDPELDNQYLIGNIERTKSKPITFFYDDNGNGSECNDNEKVDTKYDMEKGQLSEINENIETDDNLVNTKTETEHKNENGK